MSPPNVEDNPNPGNIPPTDVACRRRWRNFGERSTTGCRLPEVIVVILVIVVLFFLFFSFFFVFAVYAVIIAVHTPHSTNGCRRKMLKTTQIPGKFHQRMSPAGGAREILVQMLPPNLEDNQN